MLVLFFVKGGNKVKKLKEFNFTKKILAIIFTIVTLFGTAQPIFAVESSGSGKWVSGQYDSGIYTTDNKYQVGTLVRRLVNSLTGEKITVFCRRIWSEFANRGNKRGKTFNSR